MAGFVRGAISVTRTPAGILPLRLPEWAWSQVPDALTRELFRMSAGVRLALTTEATALEVDVAATRMSFADFDFTAFPVVFDLLVDGRDQAQQPIDRVAERTFNLEGELLDESQPVVVTLRFDGLPGDQKNLELWFPASTVVELRALRADAPLQVSEETRPRWIHYGSSISHGMEAHSPTGTWPAIAARLADVELLSLGVAGQCHLDPFVARAIRDTPAACISLKVGINIAEADTLKYRTFVPAVHGFLDTVREGHPDAPILVISPIICPMLEDSAGPVALAGGGPVHSAGEQLGKNALSMRRMREILKEIVDVRAADDQGLYYLDGLHLFGEGDIDELPDGVHPSPAGYVRIGERFAATAFTSPGCFADTSAAATTAD